MSLSEAYNLLTHISILSVLVPLTVCGIKRKALSNSMRALFVYLCICLASDTLGFFFVRNEILLNQITNTFTILECVIICSIYSIEFKTRAIKVIIAMVLLSFLLLAWRQFFYLKMFTKGDNLLSSWEAVIIVILSATYFVKFLKNPEINNLKNYYFFWIVLSNLSYFSTAFIFFLFGAFINNAPTEISSVLWGLHDVINIGCYILFAIGLWKTQEK